MHIAPRISRTDAFGASSETYCRTEIRKHRRFKYRAGDQEPVPVRARLPVVTRRRATTLLRSYAFTLTSSCGECGLIGDYRVTVRDGQVSDVDSLNEDYPYEPRLAEVPTLQDLVSMAESARPDQLVKYVVNETGVPASLSLDPVPNGIDDEECYEVVNLLPLT
ncbi:DUF6174 domain-containing protein [Nocardioides pantholopis]|uniref:DUF6174 domain-containing protein n=1 Tax=Nocardioides pantholopis TaxID=2483798 RepID=UPI001F15379F|nr:DUF6174 domain-containing protein [Nocardioides pantholopis]